MPQPLVSVIIPTYNRSAFLRSALDSVLRQTLDELELIVIDDGSRDDTPALLDSLADRRVRVTTHTLNRGIAEARNSGFLAARGKYVAWLDSDDVCRPDRLARQVHYLEAHSQIAVVGGCAGKINRHGHRSCGIRVPPFNSDDIRCWLLFKSAFQQSSVMGRAAILKDTPYDRSFSVCEDIDVLARIARRHRLANLPRILVDRRIHGSQISRERRSEVCRAQARISAPQLAAMGVEFSEEDLLSHAALARSPRPPNGIVDREWAAEWLSRLIGANRRTDFVNPSALQFLAACLQFNLDRRLGADLLRSVLWSRALSARSASWLAQAVSVGIREKLARSG